jgi:2-isopropylmalate synthase
VHHQRHRRTRRQRLLRGGRDGDQNLSAASKLVARLAKMAVAPNKAIVGYNAFRHESGIHQHGMLVNSATYQIIDPASVGAERISLELGKLSGKHALRHKIVELGFEVGESDFARINDAFKDLAAKKKLILDEDVRNIVSRMLN